MPMRLLVTFLWALAEGTFWPFMPDAILVPLALARPWSWWRLVLAAMLGTTLGGMVSYLLGSRWPGRVTPDWTASERSAIERLPLVRPAMVAAADRWLAEDGPRGAWRQPASGIPMKVFARLAGLRGLPLVSFLLWSVAARSLRFTIAAGGASLLARYFRPHVQRWYWPLTLLWALIFGAGLWRTVAFWSRKPVA
jgi:membrane protein YqaA with SNARE-associated domain